MSVRIEHLLQMLTGRLQRWPGGEGGRRKEGVSVKYVRAENAAGSI